MENAARNNEEEKDVKPIVHPATTKSSSSSAVVAPNLNSKKWSPSSLQGGNRKSAFQPYKQSSCTTVLTNLQRGNTQAETPVPQLADINFHTRAGQGEVTESDIVDGEVDILDENGLTALHWACYYGHFNSVQLLLDHKAEVNKLGPEEESPLILAASGGHHEVVRLLISRGAKVNHVDHLCNSALMYAAKGNHPHTCQELLLQGANFSLVNLNDDTALSIAIGNNCNLCIVGTMEICPSLLCQHNVIVISVGSQFQCRKYVNLPIVATMTDYSPSFAKNRFVSAQAVIRNFIITAIESNNFSNING